MAEKYPIVQCEESGRVPEHALQQWRDAGFVIVRGLFEASLVEQSIKDATEIFPDDIPSTHDFGSMGKGLFPTGRTIDDMTVHPNLIDVAERALRGDVLLSQTDIWYKRGEPSAGPQSNQNQRMHMDYGNNTFMHPAPWDTPEVMAMIVYLNDISVTGGSTAVVPREGKDDPAYVPPYINMPGQAGKTFHNNKEAAEEHLREHHPEVAKFREQLYAREIKPKPKAGDILLYRHDIWHRGTPLNPGQLRRVINIAYKKKECTWIYQWERAFSYSNYYGRVEKVFIRLTPKQWQVLGIPPPGDAYWNEEKITFMEARYPGVNMTPYRKALKQ